MITKKNLAESVKDLGWTVEPLKKDNKDVKGEFIIFTKRTAPVNIKISAKAITLYRTGGKELFNGKIKTTEALTLVLKRILL